MLGKHLTTCENSLTAAVFGHLLHLPIELFWQVLRNACYTDRLPPCPGEPTLVTPWPSWDATGTRNSTRVEPDLFLRFPNLDLIVEAKRRDERQQNPEQWRDQLIAYANEYAGEGTRPEVRLIALGGLWGHADEEIKVEVSPAAATAVEIRCPVHMCRWGRLLEECRRLERELGRAGYATAQTHAHRRILADLIGLFAVHGFQTGTWFAEVVRRPLPRPGAALDTHHQAFRRLHF